MEIIIDVIDFLIGWIVDIAESLGIDVPSLDSSLSGSYDDIFGSSSVDDYYSASTYYDSGNYGNITITQTTTNNFSGSNTSTYAVANSTAQSGQSWLSRQLSEKLVR